VVLMVVDLSLDLGFLFHVIRDQRRAFAAVYATCSLLLIGGCNTISRTSWVISVRSFTVFSSAHYQGFDRIVSISVEHSSYFAARIEYR
jgi:hypothetical protein